MPFKIDCKKTANYADHAGKLRASIDRALRGIGNYATGGVSIESPCHPTSKNSYRP